MKVSPQLVVKSDHMTALDAAPLLSPVLYPSPLRLTGLLTRLALYPYLSMYLAFALVVVFLL